MNSSYLAIIEARKSRWLCKEPGYPPVDFEWLFELPSTEAMAWMKTQSKRSNVCWEHSFYLLNNPSNCGSRYLEFLLQIEKFGLSITNYQKSMWLIAQLYNAVQQLGILETSWPDLDRIIELHKTTMFRGKLPEDEEQFHKWFLLGYGIKPSRLMTHLRSGGTVATLRNNLAELDTKPIQPSSASSILRLLGDKTNPITMRQCLHQMNLAMEKQESSQSKTKSKKRETTRSQVSSVQFLERLRDWFPKEVRDMQIDWVGLNKTCTDLLTRIRLAILTELEIKHKIYQPPGWASFEGGLIIMTQRILES